jgi:hypothetical protein
LHAYEVFLICPVREGSNIDVRSPRSEEAEQKNRHHERKMDIIYRKSKK